MLLGWLENRRQALRKKGAHPQVLARQRLRSLGIAVQVLQEPAYADRDHSGIIEPKEALLLGVALGPRYSGRRTCCQFGRFGMDVSGDGAGGIGYSN